MANDLKYFKENITRNTLWITISFLSGLILDVFMVSLFIIVLLLLRNSTKVNTK
jgi:hypothetical protein